MPGAGAFEVAASAHLENYKKTVTGKQRLGVEIFAKALLCIPKTLMENSGRIGSCALAEWRGSGELGFRAFA